MYGFGSSQPSGQISRASSLETEPAMMTSSPCCQRGAIAGGASWGLHPVLGRAAAIDTKAGSFTVVLDPSAIL